MKKQLIIDTILFKPVQNIIMEGKNRDTGIMYVEGILQRADATNQNGRRYPKDLLEREAEKYAETFIKENRAFGELDHPDNAVIEAKNASHTVEDLWWDGDDLYGRLEILNGVTPNGTIVANILNRGKTLGISSRGLGSVNQIDESTTEVDDDFELLCWDFVTNPSTQGAFMEQVNEGFNANIIKKPKYYFIDRICRDIISDTTDIYNIK